MPHTPRWDRPPRLTRDVPHDCTVFDPTCVRCELTLDEFLELDTSFELEDGDPYTERMRREDAHITGEWL